MERPSSPKLPGAAMLRSCRGRTAWESVGDGGVGGVDGRRASTTRERDYVVTRASTERQRLCRVREKSKLARQAWVSKIDDAMCGSYMYMEGLDAAGETREAQQIGQGIETMPRYEKDEQGKGIYETRDMRHQREEVVSTIINMAHGLGGDSDTAAFGPMALLGLNAQTTALILVIIIIAVLIRSYTTPAITRNGKKLRTPPNTLPLLGNGILFLRARQTLFAWFVKCERLFGHETLRISVPSLPHGVIITDPRNLDFVFKHEGIFEKGAFFKARSWDLFGHGIINVDGDLWRLQRKAGLQFLSAANLRVLTGVALPAYVTQSVEFLARRADAAEVVDLQAVVHEVTTQLMGRMAYNMEMHAGDDFTRAFEYASGATAERFQNPLWFLTELLAGAKMRRALATVKAYGQRIVASAVADRTAVKAPSGSKVDDISGSLVQSLLDSIGDEKLVADAALNYLSAGRDTVAQALTWVFYLLIKNPRVAEELQRTLQHITAGADADPETLTPSALPYATAIFYESLRLYPPVPFEIKQAQQDTHLPDGTFLPRSSIVVWCPWAMNRSRETWGPDADVFQPERWLVDGAVVSRSAAEFPVFNGGSRLCLGKRMAEVMAVQVIARLAKAFDFEPAFEGERVSRSSLTLPMEGGLPVYVRRREDARAAT
ncbi:hypothetical protein G7046_g10071 [Stylonectria norvegica]|nr:hypothetical protein G7046_g10071 [Stylonectria norvegica]